MHQMALSAILFSATVTTASAEGLVEIRHSALRGNTHTLYYWCVERDQVPAEYDDPTKYVIADQPMEKREGGLLIMSQPDYGVFLTSEDCVEETIESFKSYGGSSDDLTLTNK